MTDYTDIIRRLTEAEGPSRELDWHIGYAVDFHDNEVAEHTVRYILDTYGIYYAVGLGPHYSNIWNTLLPHWSSSLDASIALCEMMLPAMWGRKHEGANFDEEGWSYEVRVGADDGKYHLGIHNHEPIALLIAMFRALAQSKAGE